MDVFEAVRAAREVNGVPGAAVGVLEEGNERHDAHGRTSLENPLEVTPETRLLSESLRILVTHECVRSSKFGLRMAIGITVICGLPFALASQPKRWQYPQYWQGPNFDPSGLV